MIANSPTYNRRMPLLFSYGTLQDSKVQVATFGRRLAGRRDEIVGYETALVPIGDAELAARLGRTHHANVTANGRDASRVSGTVLEVTDDELARADVFESQFDYRRVAARLASGGDAWVYLH
jgi:gamma-glutamylcyclotransferase (GGCT)/AIG2-like uncharacterized protein YtfP